MTPTLSEAVRVIPVTVRAVAVEGMVKVEMVGLVVSAVGTHVFPDIVYPVLHDETVQVP